MKVIEATLREFHTSIRLGKDAERYSWKKEIYKIIARFDEPIPDYFKTPQFLQRLADIILIKETSRNIKSFI